MSDRINPEHYIGSNGIECHQAQLAIVGAEGMKAYWTSTTMRFVTDCGQNDASPAEGMAWPSA